MAEALLRARLAERGVDGVHVHSAGLLPGGEPATPDARLAVPGLDGHVSRQLTKALVEGADLVVAMTRQHLREAAVRVPGAFARTFTLRDLVRRAERAGARGDEPFDAWLAALGSDRRAGDYVRDDADDDIADPVGRPLAEYEATARELDVLLTRFVELAWGR
jgi:protein-tyrosine phosphatase